MWRSFFIVLVGISVFGYGMWMPAENTERVCVGSGSLHTSCAADNVVTVSEDSDMKYPVMGAGGAIALIGLLLAGRLGPGEDND